MREPKDENIKLREVGMMREPVIDLPRINSRYLPSDLSENIKLREVGMLPRINSRYLPSDLRRN